MNEANEAHRAASAIAALKLTQLAFAALVKKGILPTADLNTAMPPTVTHQLANKIRLFTPWSLPGPVSGKHLGSARLAQDEEPGLLSVRNRGRNGCPKNASFYCARV
jgi:hypothetical protein